MVRAYIPRPIQKPMIDFGLEHPRCALLAKMGVGKTSATLAILDTLLMAGEIRRPIVFAPLRVARSTWPEEAPKWEQYQHLKIRPIVGTADERKAALRNDKADIYTVNYDVLPWLVEHLGVDGWPFDMGIADEATKLKSFRLLQGGKRAQALASVAHKKMHRWINLTGTFASNGLGDLWGPMWFIDQGRRLGRTYDAFEARWFGYQRAKDAVHAHVTRIKRIAFPHAQAEILDTIKDVAIALDPKDWFPISKPIVTQVWVDLPPPVKKLYRDMEREMFMHLKGYDIEAFASSGKVIKCIAEGTEVLTDRGWAPIETVTSQDRVWDGVEWVTTQGAVYNGRMPVVDCWGVSMTPDHKVMTTSGWRQAQEIIDADARGGFERPAVRIPDRAPARRILEPEQVEAGDVALPMCLRHRGSAYREQSEKREPRPKEVVRLPPRRDAVGRLGFARHDGAPGLGHLVPDAQPMSQPRQQRLAQLRWARDQGLRTLATVVRQLLGRYGADMGAGVDAGSKKERRQLHPKQLPVGDRAHAVEQPQGEHFHSDPEGPHDRSPGRGLVWGQEDHAVQAAGTGVEGQGRARTARVYDIVNAGPRNRFVVRGSPQVPAVIAHNCLQLANGAVYTGSDEQIERDVSHWVEAHDEKLQALESIIEEMQGEPVLVAYHFKPDLARLKKRFPKGRHINKKQDEDDFKAGLIDVAFVHAQSIGHGVDGFQNVCRAIVFFALWWDLETHDQLIERIGPMRQMQAGLNREVLVYMILARGTVDETVAERLVSKRAVQDATFDSLSYKGEELWM